MFKKLMSYEDTLRIVTSLTPAEIEEKLKDARRTSAVTFFTKERLAGKVTVTQLKLWRLRPFVGNSFAPCFCGSIRVADGHTVVEGNFRMGRLIRAFMALWFGFLIVVGLAGVLTAAGGKGGLILLAFALPSVGMLAGGLVFLQAGKAIGRKDIPYIKSELGRIVEGRAESAHEV